MNRQFEQRLRRLEQKQSQTILAKKAWLPEWLSDKLSKDHGLPFDSEERGLDSLRQIQKLNKKQPLPETPSGEPQAPLEELEPEPGPSAMEWK